MFQLVIKKIQLSVMNDLDTYISIIGVFFGLLIISMYVFISKTIHLLMLGLALFLASLLYLAIKNRTITADTTITQLSKRLYEIAFFVIFSASLLVLHTNEGRPFLYFVLIALAAGFLSLAILGVRSRIDVGLQIMKILMVSFNLKYSIFLLNWGRGVDYWAHLAANAHFAEYGFIYILPGKESFYPLMHIQVAIHQIITNTPIKEATNFGIIIPLVVTSIFVYLVAKKLINIQIGLLALLIVNITDYHIMWGSSPQTTTFGICLFYVFIFAIFMTYTANTNKKIWLYISILFIPTLILTHAVSSYIALITLLGLTAGLIIYRPLFNKSEIVWSSVTLCILNGIMLMQHWFIASTYRGESFFDYIIRSLERGAESAEYLGRPETIVEYAMALPPVMERAADTAGIAILMFLAIICCLFWLSKHNRSQITFSMIICTVLLLFITFVFPLFGIQNIIPSRWFSFFYFFLSIMAAFAIFLLLTRISIQGVKKTVCFILIIGLSFFMISSTISNEDSPLWLQESTISTSYTIQEGVGAETVTRISDKVMLDSRYSQPVGRTSAHQTERQIFRNQQQISSTPDTVFMWRDYMLDRPIRLFMTLEGYDRRLVERKILGKDFLMELEKFDKIYQNGDISGFYLI